VEPITRRQALRLGALGALGVVVGGAGLSRTGLPWAGPGGAVPGAAGGGDRLVEPEVVRSEGGVLRAELVAVVQELEVGGRRARVLGYNGRLPGQTWRVRPGERIEVHLVNRLATPTNLHTHGLHVSPEGRSDNTAQPWGPTAEAGTPTVAVGAA
jgi:FtsP/CotA-like multicopper oxidase with cupredoxin domain